ncbi:hypothetical protein SpCBS45565_g03560 [Spizellomyces sp. 'palustris']|nr:hypothetical protein SpCBS45565_g03560 [Spizellomyces sp. 'palustris']
MEDHELLRTNDTSVSLLGSISTSIAVVLRSLFSVPWHFFGFLSYSVTATITFNYWTLLVVFLLCATALYLVVRYRLLTRYSRLPAPQVAKLTGVSFDLHPDTAFDDDKDHINYPDELMGAFLSSIKIFGYLDRAVFHELARHLRTRKLKAGEVLFRSDDDVRDFYVVVDGAVQVFVKGQEDKEEELLHLAPEMDEKDGTSVGRDWPGHHLLNEVHAGGTVSSLFNILSVFTEKMELDSTLSATADTLNDAFDTPPEHLTASQEVFPGLRRTESAQGMKSKAQMHATDSGPTGRPASEARGTEDGFNQFDEQHLPDTEPGLSPSARKDLRIATANILPARSRSVHANIATRAATDTTLAVIPAEAFQKLTEKFPKAAAHMVQVILTRFQRVTFMTLYRYLGLSKELLKIEKRVNEIAGYGLPENLFSLADFQRLRERANVMRGIGDGSLSDAGIRPTSGKRDVHKASPRVRRTAKFKDSQFEESYEGDVEDSERDSPNHSIPSLVVSRPRNEGRGFRHLLDNDHDDSDLKESIFSCIAQIIGMFPMEDTISTSIASPLSSQKTSPMAYGGVPPRPRASPSFSDFDDTASTSSRMSVTSDNGSADVQILFYERGATLIREGERNSGLYFVIDGMLEASVRSSAEPAFQAMPKDGSSAGEESESPHNEGSYRRSLFFIKPGGLAGYLAAVTGYISFVTIRAKTDVYVGFLPKSVLERYIERHPSVLLSLARRLTSQISPLVFHIDAALGWDQVNAGQVLCREGELSDSIYIVLNGRLRSIIERSKADDKATFEILAEYGQGESVGEMEVLTDTARPATVHAIRDTEIAVMPKTFFNALALRHPEITIAISRIIAARSRLSVKGAGGPVQPNWSAPQSVNPAKNMVNVNMRTVAILPVNGLVPIADFARNLHNAMKLVGASVVMLDNGSIMNTLGRHAFSRIGRLKLMNWLADQEESHRMVLYVADGGVNSPWTQRCVRQADCILLVGLGDEDPEIGEFERLLISMKITARKELVLLHSARMCIPGSTAQWLKNRVWVHAHHHVQMQLSTPRLLSESSRKNTLSNLRNHFQGFTAPHVEQMAPLHLHTGIRSDFARLARRLLSKSIGLVLGGGGARGISHIGVIRALEEAGIPIDMVGGTSIGSFVGGLYARENDHVSVYGRAKMFSGRVVSKWRQIMDLTYPVTALFTGHEFNRGIWKCFKETQIEDCWLPYFAVTTNITWSRMEIHETGYMWRYVRASMSLSGYLPPLCDNGNMLLDGGYLNNLPADIMRSHGAETIIAVDVGSVDDTSPVTYGDSLSGWWVLLQRYLPFFGPYVTRKYGKIPGLADIQARLAYVSSVKQLEDAKQIEGCFYWNPPVQKYGTLEFDKFKDIFMVGYKYGNDIVKKWEMDGTLRKRFGVKDVDDVGGKGRHGRRASI